MRALGTPFEKDAKKLHVRMWQALEDEFNKARKHLAAPLRRRARAMQRFTQMKALQTFSSVQAAFQNHFNQDRRLISR